MVEGNKILTVSYGTFSCTLEGFEDSFTTMKAIAEYFRDLASDDRYFGAEPPTPDAAMLARIAEREVSRRVEATVDGNDVVLRTQIPDSSVPAPAPAVEPAVASIDEVVAPEPVEAVLPLASQVPANHGDVKALEEAALTAAKSMRPQPVSLTSATALTAGLVAPANNSGAQNHAAQADTEEDNVDHFADDAFDASELSDENYALDAQTTMEAASENAETSVSAKLDRIRAVVSPSTPSSDQTDYSEDQHAVDTMEMPSTLFEDESTALELVEDGSDDTNTEFDITSMHEVTATDTLEQPLAIESPDPIEDDMSSILATIAQSEEAPIVNSTDDTSIGDDAVVEDLAPEDNVTPPAFQDNDDAVDTSKSEDDILGGLAALDVSEVSEAEAEPEQAPVGKGPIARVMKVKRKDFDAALEAGDLEEVDVSEDLEFAPEDLETDDVELDTIAGSVASALGETSLSEEDEAELMAELAAVEQEVQEAQTPEEAFAVADVSSDTDFDDEALKTLILDSSDQLGQSDVLDAEAMEDIAEIELNPADADVPDQQDKGIHEPLDVQNDDTVERLLSKTQSEFDAPETGRRQNAIAHLKAAVAATRAERSSQGELEEVGDQTNTYREDLAKVVRPRRAEKSSKRSERPTPKVPPLTLVAAQRVDVDPATLQEENAAPVRPRRVAKGKPEANSEDLSSFQEFAEANGARELPDLLEAAGAYAAYIKGEPHFSRPELMRKVNNLAADATHSREDSLRSFGQLLREGKIVKIKKGTFAVAEDTRFRPDEARFAGE